MKAGRLPVFLLSRSRTDWGGRSTGMKSAWKGLSTASSWALAPAPLEQTLEEQKVKRPKRLLAVLGDVRLKKVEKFLALGSDLLEEDLLDAFRRLTETLAFSGGELQEL